MTSATRELWFRRFHEGPENGVRLVCFPHAGGSASSYHRFSADLSTAVEVWCVQYPGRQDRRREPQITDIPDLAEQICGALGSLADRPLAFFGHSMGALLAFEVARRRERTGGPPAALFVSGRRAPSIHRDEGVHRRDDDGLIAEISSLNGTDSRLLQDEEVRRMILPAVRADYQAVETYRYRPGRPLRTPIIALAGADDPRASREDVAAWAGHTSGGFSFHVLPGGHFFLNERSCEVARIVVDSVAQAAVPRPRPATA